MVRQRYEPATLGAKLLLAAHSPYDPIAGLYHQNWDDWYLPQAGVALERLLFSVLKPGARVLDVCCGCGHVTRELVARGYQVTGVDASVELIAQAQRDLPAATFIVADVRQFQSAERFDGALSTFDSLNHILALPELEASFRNVHQALLAEAPFVFDMNNEDAYRMDLHEWTTRVAPDSVSLVRGRFDPVTREVATEIVWFRKLPDGSWERRDSVVPQRCYHDDEIREALRQAGFRSVSSFSAVNAGVTGEIGYGRVFWSATA
jgi:SAM-dependent methyltransferase